MKKFIALVAILSLGIVGLTACGNKNDGGSSSNVSASA